MKKVSRGLLVVAAVVLMMSTGFVSEAKGQYWDWVTGLVQVDGGTDYAVFEWDHSDEATPDYYMVWG